MLQRIQTVYLLIIVGLMAAVMFLPLAVMQVGGEYYVFKAVGVGTMAAGAELVYSTWGLFVLAAAISLLALITIFLFKKRILQIRLCVFNAILMLGFYGIFAFFAWTLKGDLAYSGLNLRIALSFPVIALILDYLAIRNIGADEALVRSLERLR